MFGRKRNRQNIFSRPQVLQRPVYVVPKGQKDPVLQSPIQVVQGNPVPNESAEAASTPMIVGKNSDTMVITVVNGGAGTQQAVIFDALGAVARTGGVANGENITVASTTHDYESFKKTLETNRYQIQEMVFSTTTEKKGTLDLPLEVKTYQNGIGTSNTTDKFVPSSYKSENQFNTDIYTVRRNIELNSFKALVTDVLAGATLTLTIRFK